MRWMNENVIEVNWLMVMKRFVSEKADFEIDTFLNREPVKVFPNGLDVLAFGGECDGTCK